MSLPEEGQTLLQLLEHWCDVQPEKVRDRGDMRSMRSIRSRHNLTVYHI